MQVGVAAPSVGQARDLDLAEHRHQYTPVVSLHAASRNSVGAHCRLQARLPLCAQVQVVLEHLAEQLAILSNRSQEATKAGEISC
jgi:hypothetical protein